jgi:hypothetical protein
MKKIFNKSLLKKSMCFVLTLFLLCSSVFISGCGSVDGVAEAFFSQYIDSFKVVYSNSTSGGSSRIDPLENLFFEAILGIETYITTDNSVKGLTYFYGSADDTATINPQWFPDSIRMLVIKNLDNNAELISTNSDSIWKWTFSQTLPGNTVNNLKPNSVDNLEEYDDWKFRLWDEDESPTRRFTSAYNTTFKNMYLIPLKIVMYEAMLGYDTFTTFGPDSTGLVAKVLTSPNSSIVNDLVAKSNNEPTTQEDELDPNSDIYKYIYKLTTDFQDKTKYVGFTKTNADKLISYILDHIIGTSLVEFDYTNYGPSNTTHVSEVSKTSEDFKNLLGEMTDQQFTQYIANLKPGDVIKTDDYNHLVYKSKSGNNYTFKEYYNYRNYIDRVAETIYGMCYDGRDEFVYERKIGNVTVKYDYVARNGGKAQIGSGVLLMKQFSPTPAAFLKDFKGEAFFPDEIALNDPNIFSFRNNPRAEYQSILVMPTDEVITSSTNEDEINAVESGFIFDVAAYDKNLVIRTMVRYYYYDTATNSGTLYTFDCDDVTFDGSMVREEFDPEAGKKVYVSAFEVGVNLNALPANSKVELESGKEALLLKKFQFEGSNNINTGGDEKPFADYDIYKNYYKVIDSKNGFGGLTVLDESKINCSFYEIVLDVVKSPNDPADMDYTYRLAMLLPW